MGAAFAAAADSVRRAPDAGTAAERIRCYPSREALEADLAARPLTDALVLVKGSHGMRLDQLLDML